MSPHNTFEIYNQLLRIIIIAATNAYLRIFLNVI